MKTKKNDFIELEFTGKTKEGQIFDTTQANEALKAGLISEKDLEKQEIKEKFKPLKVCIGQNQVLNVLDKALEDKELEKEYEIEIKAKEAYGLRKSKLIRTVPLSAFEQMPEKGMFVNVNDIVAKVISITGGRVLIDMNHPLAGKDLIYKFKILRIIEDNKEKISALLESYNIKASNIEIKEKVMITIKDKINPKIKEEIEKKIKDILNLNTEFIEKEEKQKEEKEKKEKQQNNKEQKQEPKETKENQNYYKKKSKKEDNIVEEI